MLSPSFLTDGETPGEELEGYVIHMGMIATTAARTIPFEIRARNGQPAESADGAVAGDGALVGTMMHGLFENDALRARTLAHLRRRRGLTAPPQPRAIPAKQAEYDRLEAAVRAHIDCDLLRRLAIG